jgi:hypothetical protein
MDVNLTLEFELELEVSRPRDLKMSTHLPGSNGHRKISVQRSVHWHLRTNISSKTSVHVSLSPLTDCDMTVLTSGL